MFSNAISKGFNANVSNFLLKSGKLILLAGALIYISYLFLNFPKPEYINWLISIKPGASFFILLLIVFLLSIANWGFEAMKWQLLACKLQNISFARSYKGVLFGVAMGMITPKRIGEFAGKAIVLERNNRAKGIIINTAGTICQLMVTIIAGLISLFFIFNKGILIFPQMIFLPAEYIIAITATVAISFTMFFYKKQLISYLLKYKILRRVYSGLSVFKEIKKQEFLQLFVYSALRYVIFMVQCYLLFYLVGLKLSVAETFMFQSLVFFVMTILPVTAFSEIAVKGSIAILLFGQVFLHTLNSYPGYEISLIAANGLLWVINLGIPAFAGIIWQLDNISLPIKKSFIKVK